MPQGESLYLFALVASVLLAAVPLFLWIKTRKKLQELQTSQAEEYTDSQAKASLTSSPRSASAPALDKTAVGALPLQYRASAAALLEESQRLAQVDLETGYVVNAQGQNVLTTLGDFFTLLKKRRTELKDLVTVASELLVAMESLAQTIATEVTAQAAEISGAKVEIKSSGGLDHRILELHNQGLSQREIARELSITEDDVEMSLHRMRG